MNWCLILCTMCLFQMFVCLIFPKENVVSWMKLGKKTTKPNKPEVVWFVFVEVKGKKKREKKVEKLFLEISSASWFRVSFWLLETLNTCFVARLWQCPQEQPTFSFNAFVYVSVCYEANLCKTLWKSSWFSFRALHRKDDNQLPLSVSALSLVAEADLNFPAPQWFVWMSAFLCATESLQSLSFFLIW